MRALYRCNLCHIEKPATYEFFYWRDKANGILRNDCKACIIAAQTKHRRARGAKPWKAAPTKCSIDGCMETYHAGGFCLSHYNRQRRYGTPFGGTKSHRKPTIPVTLEYLFDQCIPEPNSGCWLWLNCATGLGYGRVQFKGRNRSAHRVSYMLANGIESLPSEIQVCHKCDTPPCINPDHLFAGTAKDNMQDCLSKGRQKPSFVRGEKCPASVLKAEQVRKIKSDVRKNCAAIAREYGVSAVTIRRIRSGLQWRHI